MTASPAPGRCHVRVELPYHLRTLARVGSEITVALDDVPTIGALLDAVEREHPVLCGTIRDHGTRARRPFLRYFACRDDLSHEPADRVLPEAVQLGQEPFLIIGSISGG